MMLPSLPPASVVFAFLFLCAMFIMLLVGAILKLAGVLLLPWWALAVVVPISLMVAVVVVGIGTMSGK